MYMGGRKMSEKCIPELEKKYNHYIQKIIYNESSRGTDSIVKAIIAYIAKVEGCECSNVYFEHYDEDNELYGKAYDIQYENTTITVKELMNEDNEDEVVAFLVDCSNNCGDTQYSCDMYLYLEDYMEKIASNMCPVCGEEIAGKGKFCSNCGAPL